MPSEIQNRGAPMLFDVRPLFGILGYVILNLALVPGKMFDSRGGDVFFSLITIVGEELQAKNVLGYIWHFLYTL